MNTEAIIKRIQVIVAHYGLSTSSFADSIQVQRSSMSHLLSGRNKPSLDFVTKVIHTYPEVDLYWLLKGEGSFPRNKNTTEPQEPLSKTQKSQTSIKSAKPPTLFENVEDEPKIKASIKTSKENSNKALCKVILLYNDGSFQEYRP